MKAVPFGFDVATTVAVAVAAGAATVAVAAGAAAVAAAAEEKPRPALLLGASRSNAASFRFVNGVGEDELAARFPSLRASLQSDSHLLSRKPLVATLEDRP